jgi:enoyl-CoA hydratase/carnithine racemase
VSEPELLAERADHVLTLTFNRPERLNAISNDMLRTFSAELQAANIDPDIRVVILTGAGRGFCSGLDLTREADSGGAKRTYRPFDLHNSPPVVLNRMDKPVICALNGPAAGYGMDLALGCDVRIASEHARLHAVFGKRNVVPESGGCWLLPRIVGWAKAAEIAFLSEVLDAPRALEVGLVNKVVPHDELMPEARRWAAKIAAGAPLAIQATKRMMRLGLDETFETAVDHTMLQLLPLFGTEDFQESLAAFSEKRDASFQGR